MTVFSGTYAIMIKYVDSKYISVWLKIKKITIRILYILLFTFFRQPLQIKETKTKNENNYLKYNSNFFNKKSFLKNELFSQGS